ncbi:MAG TPA: lysylphosphatidylglycerol synthase transmembrane domain-containing protein [Acidimicrobiales bacterium]|nr:lysylphosphatidylglycerol synthase transmembrane domain-containing protein [Acidimicrobiales bacterium]
MTGDAEAAEGQPASTGQPADDSADEAVELFDAPPERQSFAPGDVVRLVLGVVVVVLGVVVAEAAQSTIEGIEQDLVEALARLPDRAVTVFLGVAQVATGAVPAIALVVLVVRRRWKVALVLLLASSLASVGMIVADALVIDRDLSELLAALRADESIPDRAQPSSEAVASTIAAVTVAVPWLSPPWKRALWGGVAALAVLRLLSVSHPAFDLVLALGIGTVVGSAVLLVFGSPNRRPAPAELLDALRDGGLDPRAIGAPEADGTALRYAVTDRDGTPLDVRLRTPDERDAELLTRVYRRVRFQASEVRRPFATLKRRIEHEALVSTLAERAGARVPSVVRIGRTSGGSAFVVSERPPDRTAVLDDLADPVVLDDLWRQLRALHDAGVAHRHLTLETIRVDGDGRPWLVDFDRAQTAPSDRERARDVAELLAETASAVGAHRAVEAAVGSLGPDRVAPALRMLQPLALPPATRARLAGSPLLDELRAAVLDLTGAPELELEDLERIKPRTVLIVVASALAFYSLLPQLTNLEDTLDAFGNAQLGWIAAALLASAATYVLAAVALQGAVADPIPFAANVRAQVAASFAGLVGPAGAGGFALTARFLERNGVGAAEAGASVAVNAVAGFVVHGTLTVAFVVWAGSAGTDGFALPSAPTVLLVAAIVVALVVVVVAVAPLRRRVAAPAWRAVRVGGAQIGEVFQSPARVAALFGGSLGISLTYIAALAFSVAAFGGGVSLVQIGAAYLVAVAIASIAPTPGGLGALESAMIAGLTGFGLPAGVAVSATLTFRLATFWLPILPGWVTAGWMQRRQEL